MICRNPIVILFTLTAASACKQPVAASRDLKSGGGGADAQGYKEPLVQSVDTALTGLPSSCQAAPAPREDGQICISCSRSVEGGSAVEFPDLCFAPKENFDARLHCGYSKEGAAIRSFFCKNSTDTDASFDISLGNERAGDVMPALLLAVKAALAEKFKDEPISAKVAEEAVQFASDRLIGVLAGQDFEKTADDLILLVAKSAVTPLEDSLKETLKEKYTAKIKSLYLSLASNKSFSAGELLGGLIQLGKEIPEANLGKAKALLSRVELVALLESRKTEIESIISRYASSMGIDSFDKLIAQIPE